LELAFDSGAKVILEGPCVFRVDADGGFLQAGRLTGLCESAARDANADMASNANPPFSIRTPTATVTDLGTEFGVEVDQAGRTTSHVYRGLVEMQQTGSQDSKTKLVLREGEAASVAHDRDGNPRMARIEGVPATFVRRLPQSRIRIPVFGTGLASVGVRGEDAHWQWVARSDDPGFEPRNATIVMSARPEWTPRRSQHAEMAGPSERWISTGFVWASTVPPGAVCTFRTTFLLDESLAKHAHLQGIVRADKCVRAIRLNGHDVPSKATDGKYSWEGWMAPGGTAFAVDQGFCGGNNAIEIDVEADGSKQSEVDELRAAGADARSAVGLCATMEGWGQLPQPSETQNQR
jgi:hypothetical protein